MNDTVILEIKTGCLEKLSFLKAELYCMRFIDCDSIQICSFLSERFQFHTMKYHEYKRIGQNKSHCLSQPFKVSSQSRKFEFNVFSTIYLNGHNF